MAKGKGQKGSGGAQSHIRARISYLSQAASLLQTTTTGGDKPEEPPPQPPESSSQINNQTKASNLARNFSSQVRAMSLKSRVRLSRETKHSICKRCDTLLVPGTTCSRQVENKSKGGKKPSADVLTIRCGTCGAVKRFPQGEKRGMKLAERVKRRQQQQQEEEEGNEDTEMKLSGT